MLFLQMTGSLDGGSSGERGRKPALRGGCDGEWCGSGCGRAGAARSQFPAGLCRGADGCRCPQSTLPAEAFVGHVKFVRDLSTKGSRQVKWVIFLTTEATSLGLFESKLEIQASPNRCFRFAAAGFGRLLSASAVQEVG